ncbi:hypothetical protein TWF506_000184 [Arthrobotrys conoides]|uniref:Fido domain-containing protein n=1 Tax=Arthrobotrys conoides TaxID=74498 RepID=A0AAN8NQG6_9PEZI
MQHLGSELEQSLWQVFDVDLTKDQSERSQQHKGFARDYRIPPWSSIKPDDLWTAPESLRESSYLLAGLQADSNLQEAFEVRFDRPFYIFIEYDRERRSFDITETIKLVKTTVAGSRVESAPDLFYECLTRDIISRRDVVQHVQAFLYLKEQLSEYGSLSEDSLLECHRILTNKIPSSKGFQGYRGQHRICEISVGKTLKLRTGEEIYCPPADKVPESMNSWLICYNGALKGSRNPVAAASELKTEFLKTHPFLDGNGRMSRLLFNSLVTNYYPHTLITFGESKYERLRYRHSVRESIRRKAPGIFSFFALQRAARSTLQRLEDDLDTDTRIPGLSRIKENLRLLAEGSR